MKQCPVCSTVMTKSFTETILNKYEVDYFFCTECGLLQTEKPYWLEESYSSAIAVTDTGLVGRNLYVSKILTTILSIFFDKNANYLDVAGGTGLLVRLMRDIGFNFYWQDKYCDNVHAKGFEFDSSFSPFNAITAFEVLEHVGDPIGFIRDELDKSGANTLIFSTELFKNTPPKPHEWAYYSFVTGQHISFYQYKTLAYIAKQLNLNLYSHKSFHLLTNKSIPSWLYPKLISRLGIILGWLISKSMKSKIWVDHDTMTKRIS